MSLNSALDTVTCAQFSALSLSLLVDMLVVSIASHLRRFLLGSTIACSTSSSPLGVVIPRAIRVATSDAGSSVLSELRGGVGE